MTSVDPADIEATPPPVDVGEPVLTTGARAALAVGYLAVLCAVFVTVVAGVVVFDPRVNPFVVFDPRSPFDGRFGPLDPVLALVIGLSVAVVAGIVGLPWWRGAIARPQVWLTREGIRIGDGLIKWKEVAGVDVVTGLVWTLIKLRLHHGGPRTLPLTGTRLLGDRRLAHNVGWLCWAAATHHEAVPVRYRRTVPQPLIAAVIALIVVAAAQSAARGVRVPWARTAPADMRACQLLDRSEVRLLWPTRATASAEVPVAGDAETGCDWRTQNITRSGTVASVPEDAPGSLTLWVTVHGWSGLYAPAEAAARQQAVRVWNMDGGQLLLGLPGSGAAIARARSSVTVAAYTLNVGLRLTIDCGPRTISCPRSTEDLAVQIMQGLLIEAISA